MDYFDEIPDLVAQDELEAANQQMREYTNG